MPRHKSDFEQFIQVVTLGLAFILSMRSPNDPDMWWHLSAGRAMWERREILLQDVFSFTRAGAAWTNAFWLTDLGMYFLQNKFGFWALTLTASALAALTIYLVYEQLQGPALMRMGISLLAMLAALPVWTTRPQLVSYFLIALLDFYLSKQNNGAWKFPLLPLFFALWANLHGGFIWGFLLLLAFLAAKTIEALFESSPAGRLIGIKSLGYFSGMILLSGLAVGINPNGFALWGLPFHTVDISLQIKEWLSPDFHTLFPHPMLWLLFSLVAALGLSDKKIGAYDLFKIVGFAYLTFFSQRNMAPFAILAAPVLGRHANNVWEQLKTGYFDISPRNTKPLPHFWAGIMTAVMLTMFAAAGMFNALSLATPARIQQGYPASAVKWMKENQPQGRMFNSYNWGGYLTWNLPEYPVFIDGRADLYGSAILHEWMDVINAKDDFMDVLNKWNISLVLVEPNAGIVNELKRQNWSVVFEDQTAVILKK